MTVDSETNTEVAPPESSDARRIAVTWLSELEAALTETDHSAVADLFTADASWRDLLALSWTFSTFTGNSEVTKSLVELSQDRRPHHFEVADRVPANICERAARQVVEAYISFSTDTGECEGVVRLAAEPTGRYRAWTLMTSLDGIRGHEKLVGSRRPRTDHGLKRFGVDSWARKRAERKQFSDRDPAVLVVGGGQSGLSVAAHLGALGIDALIVEKNERIGDNWRSRYESLVLHTETPVNHLPYLPFPETFPDFVPKDMLGNWFETYSRALDLAVWTNTEFLGGEYDERTASWTVRVRHDDGTVRVLQPRHVVIAVGLSSTPRTPEFPGLARYEGPVLHSSQFRSGREFSGKKVVVVGAGNSGCDIAQDLYAYGAAEVTLIQRGAITVISLNAAIMMFSLYSSGMSTEDCDLLALADPYPVMIRSHQEITKVIRGMDTDMSAKLGAGGFETTYGEDESGSSIQYFRKGGGYYVDVGIAELIGSGAISVRQHAEVEHLTPHDIEFTDGSTSEVDLVVFATGYEGVEPSVDRLFGKGTAAKVGPLWGFDPSGELRGMFTRTGQPGLWFVAGGIPHARWFSHYTALQLQACELGLISPVADEGHDERVRQH